MLPVILSIGPISISSLGLFLVLAFLFGTFLIWRLARAWELDSEILLDVVFFTTIFGFIGARIYFVLVNFDFFYKNLMGALNIFRVPGFSFWGAFFGGILALYICTKFSNIARRLSLGVLFSSFSASKSLNFYQVADIGAVGFLGGLILADLGCLLGGCDIGIQTNSFFAIEIIGAVGKRFPVQFVEAVLFLYILQRIWPQATKFHFHGKILSKTLIYVGLVKFFMQFFRDFGQQAYLPLAGFIFSLLTFILGVFIYYKTSKGSLALDIKKFYSFLWGIFFSTKIRKEVVEGINRSWYNRKVSLSWKFKNFKKLLRRARVKPTPENFQ